MNQAVERTISQTALKEFQDITGITDTRHAREVMRDEFEHSKFVRVNDNGAELYRGARPRRLQFIVHVSDGKNVIAHVHPEHRGTRRSGEARTITIRTFSPSGSHVETELVVTETILGTGPARRVSFRLLDGRWTDGTRGSRPGEILDFKIVDERPEWAKNLG